MAPAAALGFSAEDNETKRLGNLMNEIAALRLEVRPRQRDEKSGRRDRDDKKKKTQDRDRRHDRSRRRRRHGSRSRANSSSSRSSKGSSGSGSAKAVRWKHRGRNRSADPPELNKLETTSFKRRGELLAYAASHPGALTGDFLAAVHQRCGLGTVKESKQLRNPSVRKWAARESGAMEIRDLCAIATLAALLDHANMGEVEQALGIPTQRILSVQMAKPKGRSWDKSVKVELIPTGATYLVPAGVSSQAG